MKEGRRDSYKRGRMDNDMEVSMEMLQGTDMEGVWLEKLDIIFYYAASEITPW